MKRRKLPGGGVSWRAHFTDPETDKRRYVTLEDIVLPNARARREWAIKKSKLLAQRRMDIEFGIPIPTRTLVADALSEFYDSREGILAAKTIRNYQLTTVELQRWCDRRGVKHIEDLSKRHLMSLRDHFVRLPRKTAKRGGRRGERKKQGKPRSIGCINRDFNQLKAVLNDLRRRDLLPHLDRDAISDCLKRLPAPRHRPTFLAPDECNALLQAALHHDAEMFKLTRAEHDGDTEPGTTPRYNPVAPFVAYVLLTGSRLSEAEHLKWEYCQLGAKDHDGKIQGEIHLPPEATKTNRARTIYLDVCPQLRQLLAAMKLQSPRGEAYVFGGERALTRDRSAAAQRRLKQEYDAPAQFCWQLLRRTTGTYLTNAPAIFGSASVYRSAAQLGHSVVIAEKHYLGVTRGIPRDARTLEAAMQVEGVMRELLALYSQRRRARG